MSDPVLIDFVLKQEDVSSYAHFIKSVLVKQYIEPEFCGQENEEQLVNCVVEMCKNLELQQANVHEEENLDGHMTNYEEFTLL
jgi:hypothetical protein